MPFTKTKQKNYSVLQLINTMRRIKKKESLMALSYAANGAG